MRSKKLTLLIALCAVIAVSAAVLTACNSDEAVYDRIFTLCSEQHKLAITVRQGDVTVYTYKDGVGSSDFTGLQIDASAYIQAAENAGKKLALSDFTSDAKASFDEVTGAFEIEGALADAASVLGVDVNANVHLKGNYIGGKVDVYEIAYQHNGFDVLITLV